MSNMIFEDFDTRIIFDNSESLGENEILNMEIYSDTEMNMSIWISKSKFSDDFYFKVFDHERVSKSTRSCRIKVSKCSYKKCNDSLRELYVLNNKEKQWLIGILKSKPYEPFDYYNSVWEFIIKELYHMSGINIAQRNKKILKLLNKIPNYTQLPEYE